MVVEGPNKTNKWWERGSEEKKKILLERINRFLNDYSDEIPGEVVHSTSENINYKVRTGWFATVNVFLETCKEVGEYFPESFTKKVKDFLKSFQERQKESIYTTPEEIQKANDLLRRAKGYLEEK